MWTVFRDTVGISLKQLAAFEGFKNFDKKVIRQNSRAIQVTLNPLSLHNDKFESSSLNRIQWIGSSGRKLTRMARLWSSQKEF